MIATVSDLTQLQNFAGASRSLLVTDTDTGGIFNYKNEVLTPDGVYIIPADGIGSGYWVKKPVLNTVNGVEPDATGDVELTGEDGVEITDTTLGLAVPLKSDYVTNTFVGDNAGLNNTYLSGTQGAQNTFVGTEAGRSNTTGYAQDAVGYGALYKNTTGNGNVALGYQALYENITNNFNTATGTDAGYRNTGDRNNYYGHHSGKGTVGSTYITGSDNMFFGWETGTLSTSGSFNSFFGNRAGFNHTTGSHNTVLGYLAGFGLTSGSMNTISGREAGQALTTQNNNVINGYRAGYNLTSPGNTIVGFSGGFNTTTGQGNSFFGSGAGDDIITGSNNTFIGLNAGNNASQSTSANFSTAVGYNSYTTKSNQMVLGHSGITETLLRGTNLVNTETDDGTGSKLQVNGTASVSNGTASGHAVNLGQLNAYTVSDGNISKTANYTIVTADYGKNGTVNVYVDATAGAVQITLEAAATMGSATATKTVNVIKTDSSVNAVTVKGNGSTNINGANTYVISTQYDNASVKSNGTQYYIFT